jgi:hypothetical protein
MRKTATFAAVLWITLLAQGSAVADDIFAAARRGDGFAVRHYLRKFPGSASSVDGFRYTALHWAAVRGEWEPFAILVQAGAPVNALGWDGGTPLHLAAHFDRPDMIRLLLDHGADLSIHNQWGRTPLHVSARRNCDLTASLLLDRGADPNAVTKEGWTPLHVAYKAGHPAMVDLLLARGADPERRDGEGKVPAAYAMKRPAEYDIDPAGLDEYAGRYAVSPRVEAEVWVEQDRLFMAEFGPNELYATGKDTFFCRREPWTVRFLRDREGGITRMEIDFLRRTVGGDRLPEYEYVGSGVCGECHLRRDTGSQYVAWMQSGHGRAYWELKTEWAKFLASIREEYADIQEPVAEWRCLKCHVTGAQDRHAGFAERFTEEEGVGCEACHGPGSAYIDPEVMTDRDRFLENGGRVPDERTCRTCHEDDRFHFDERLPKIAHPRPDAEG